MAGPFEARLSNGLPLVADGGMGSLLTAAVPRLRTPEEANLRAPEAVVSLHVSFIEAGAELIETNTFGANRRKLAAHYLDDELERINTTGVKLAREARQLTGRDVFIGGAVGPLGEQLPPPGRARSLAEQAAQLEDRRRPEAAALTLAAGMIAVSSREGSPICHRVGPATSGRPTPA